MKKKVPNVKRHSVKKVDKKLIEELLRYEDDSPDGVFAVPPSPDAPRVKVRALNDYCK